MYSLLVVSTIVCIGNVNSLSSSKSPGGNFDLSNWKITLPDSSASEKSPDQLEDGYESSYFYTDSDGSMTFYVKGNGGTTSGSSYPRSELRSLCNPDNSKADRYNWKASSSGGYHYVDGKYKIGKLDSSSRKVVIQQIHAYDAPPLVKIQYQSGKVYALVKTDSSGNNEDKFTIGEVDQYTQFSLKTVMSSGYLKLYFNGSQKKSIKVRDYWSGYTNYFKAGNYLQSSSSSAYAYIHLYYLKVFVKSGKCVYDSSFTYADDAETSGNTAIAATAVSIVALLCIGGAIFGYCYWKKNKSGKATFKDSVDGDSKGGDAMTASDGAVTGQDTPNSTNNLNAAYDMDEIEIEVPVDDGNDEETHQ